MWTALYLSTWGFKKENGMFEFYFNSRLEIRYKVDRSMSHKVRNIP